MPIVYIEQVEFTNVAISVEVNVYLLQMQLRTYNIYFRFSSLIFHLTKKLIPCINYVTFRQPTKEI